MRTRPSNRRFSITQPVEVQLDGGKTQKVLVTYGFDSGKVREMFCADFKAGSMVQAFVMDACVMASLLLQYNISPRELYGRMTDGPSLIGAIVYQAALLEEQR